MRGAFLGTKRRYTAISLAQGTASCAKLIRFFNKIEARLNGVYLLP
jgi:hypothetical protein